MAIRYTVKPGDSASSLAGKYARDPGRWGELRAVNPPRNWNTLRPGDVLIFPSSWAPPGAPGIGGLGGPVGALTLERARAQTHWLPDAFFERFDSMCQGFGIPTMWGMGILFHESGVQPWRQNAAGATGLMQWMPAYAPVPTSQLVKMTALEQLEYIRRWWSAKVPDRGGAFRSPGEVYCIVIAPAFVKPSVTDASVIYARPPAGQPGHDRPPPDKAHEWRYWGNEHLDTNGDGVIDVADLTRSIVKAMSDSDFDPFRTRVEALGGPPAPPVPQTPSQSPEGAAVAASSRAVTSALGTAARAAAITLALAGAAIAVSRAISASTPHAVLRGVARG